MKTTRQALHTEAVKRVAAMLRHRGCAVDRIEVRGGIELAVTGLDGRERRCAVRASRVVVRNRVVRYRDKIYRYEGRYRERFFNLHAHGKRQAEPDVWLLVADAEVFVVPAQAVVGKLTVAVCELGHTSRGTTRRSRIRDFAGRWDLATGKKARRAA